MLKQIAISEDPAIYRKLKQIIEFLNDKKESAYEQNNVYTNRDAAKDIAKDATENPNLN